MLQGRTPLLSSFIWVREALQAAALSKSHKRRKRMLLLRKIVEKRQIKSSSVHVVLETPLLNRVIRIQAERILWRRSFWVAPVTLPTSPSRNRMNKVEVKSLWLEKQPTSHPSCSKMSKMLKECLLLRSSVRLALEPLPTSSIQDKMNKEEEEHRSPKLENLTRFKTKKQSIRLLVYRKKVSDYQTKMMEYILCFTNYRCTVTSLKRKPTTLMSKRDRKKLWVILWLSINFANNAPISTIHFWSKFSLNLTQN